MDERGEPQLTVLIIDDEPQVCALIARFLLREGHQVVTAGSAEEGLEQLPFYRFDVAFLDQNLPGMDGLVLGEFLRSNNPEMQIALVTADTDARLVRSGRRHDIKVIHKPFTGSQILDVLEGHRDRLAQERRRVRARRSERYELALGPWLDALPGLAGQPALSARQRERLVSEIKHRLHRLRSGGDVDPEDRVVAYAALVAARLFDVVLPKRDDGGDPFEEFDQLMARNELKCAFGRGGSGDEA